MARPTRPKTVVKNKLVKKLTAKMKQVKAKKRRSTARAVAKIKARYTNLG